MSLSGYPNNFSPAISSRRVNILEEFKKIVYEDVEDILESTNTGKKKEGYKGIRDSKYSNVANLGFPIGDNYSIEEERKKYGEREKNWIEFLTKYPFDSDWTTKQAKKKLKKLVRQGICPKFRHKVWMKMSDSFQLRERNGGYYHSILQSHEKFPPKKGVAHDIEQDLKRTFPEHEMFGNQAEGKGLIKMRRVLLAYSWRNPLIAYCQCFNYIVGMLLLHYEDEEDVFWMFVQIVEELLPSRYFDPNLHGAQADNRLFNTLFSLYIPNLYEHLVNNFSDPGSVLCSGWFMSLYVTAFPPTSALRIWDVFFLEGPIVLHMVALSFFKVHEERLLRAKSGSLLEILRSLPKSTDEKILDERIFHLAFHSGYFSEMMSVEKKKKNKKNKKGSKKGSGKGYIELIRKKYFLQVGKEIESNVEKKREKEEEDMKFILKMREKHKKIEEEKKKKLEEEEEGEGEGEKQDLETAKDDDVNEKLRKELEEMKRINKILKDENEVLKKEVEDFLKKNEK